MDNVTSRPRLQNLKVSKPQIEVPQHLSRKVGVIKHRFADSLMDEFGFTDKQTIGPRSVFTPEKLMEAIYRYDGVSTFNVDKAKWARARSLVRSYFSGIKVTPLPLDEGLYGYVKPDTSSGFPLLTSKREAFPKALEDARLLISGRGNPYPCVSYKRTQGASSFGGESKVRLVWGYPMDMILIEATVARPILDALALGQDTIASGLRRVQLATKLDHLRWYPAQGSFDWSKFDATIPTQVVSTAFDIVEGMLTEVPEYMQLVRRYFSTCAIVDPFGRVIKGRRRGIPSGSFFTSIVGSISNLLMITYLLLDKGVKWEIMVLGDDSVLGLSGRLNTTQMVEEAMQTFGMVLKPDKLSYTAEVKFLGHAWIKGQPHRPVQESFQRLVYPERLSPWIDPCDLVMGLYSDNASLWEHLPFRWKRRSLQWSGPDLTGLANWESTFSPLAKGAMLTL